MKIFKRLKKSTEDRSTYKVWGGILAGALLGFSFPPIPFPFFIFFAFIPFLLELEKRETLLSINKLTYMFGLITNIITLYWVGSWSKEADPFLMISGGVLIFFNPLLFFIPSTIYYYAKKVFNKNIALWLFPLFWVAYEYAYTITEFRFPWLTLGNSVAYFTSYIQIADIIGVHGLSLIILYTNIVLYLCYKNFRLNKKLNYKTLIAGFLLILIPIVYGASKIIIYKPYEKKVKVGLIQPNLNPWDKWKAGSVQTQLNMYFDLSKKAINEGAELLFYPETALPIYLLDGQHYRFVKQIMDFTDSNNVTIFTGMPHLIYYYGKENFPKNSKPTLNKDVSYTSFNSVLKFSPHYNKIDYYGKIMLVPFGEKVPYAEDIPFIGDLIKWEVGISSWNVGKDTVVFKTPLANNNDSVSVGTVVCIESIYSQFVSSFVKKGAEFIAVVTNDSWYGNSSGPYQHKSIGIIRAVENRRYVVRAANGGISCIINPLGETLKKSSMYTQDVIVGEIGLSKEITFYTKYPNIIIAISIFVSLMVIVIFISLKLKKLLKI